MTNENWESTQAWHELLDGLRELDQTFLAGDRAVSGEHAVADGYRMLTTILGVGLDTYLYAEPEPAGLRRHRHALPPRPALGRRQHRLLLLLRRARPDPQLPDHRPAR